MRSINNNSSVYSDTPFLEAVTKITEKYPGIKNSLIVSNTFAPVLEFVFNDIKVSKKLSMISILDMDCEYWINILEELIQPITRDMKIDKLND